MVALSAIADSEARAAPGAADPLVWVLHDGKAGMASQALGLAEAAGFPLAEKRLSVRRPWAWLPPQLWLTPLRAVSEAGVALTPPWPDLVIGCGRHTAMPALAIHPPAAATPSPRRSRTPGSGAANSTCYSSPSTTACAARASM